MRSIALLLALALLPSRALAADTSPVAQQPPTPPTPPTPPVPPGATPVPEQTPPETPPPKPTTPPSTVTPPTDATTAAAPPQPAPPEGQNKKTSGAKTRPGELAHDWPIDGTITVAAGGFWLFTELNKDHIAGLQCRFCDPNGLDKAVTDAIGVQNNGPVIIFSNLIGYVGVPVATLGGLGYVAFREGRSEDIAVNSLVMLESLALAGATTQIVKFAVLRERPFVNQLPPDQKLQTESPHDNNVSFFSNHSAATFALAVSAGTIAHLRHYDAEPVVWAVGIPLASITAVSRIVARKHYLTDVLVGSAVGAGFGFGIPWFFHQPRGESKIAVLPTADGMAVAGLF